MFAFDDRKVANGINIPVDMIVKDPKSWVTADQMDVYCDYLNRLQGPVKDQKIIVFNSYFIASLQETNKGVFTIDFGRQQSYFRDATQLLEDLNGGGVKGFVFPLNRGNNHWVCVHVNHTDKKPFCVVKDSMLKKGQGRQLDALLEGQCTMAVAAADTFVEDYFFDLKAPQQNNSNDCGIFTMLSMREIVFNACGLKPGMSPLRPDTYARVETIFRPLVVCEMLTAKKYHQTTGTILVTAAFADASDANEHFLLAYFPDAESLTPSPRAASKKDKNGSAGVFTSPPSVFSRIAMAATRLNKLYVLVPPNCPVQSRHARKIVAADARTRVEGLSVPELKQRLVGDRKLDAPLIILLDSGLPRASELYFAELPKFLSSRFTKEVMSGTNGDPLFFLYVDGVPSNIFDEMEAGNDQVGHLVFPYGDPGRLMPVKKFEP